MTWRLVGVLGLTMTTALAAAPPPPAPAKTPPAAAPAPPSASTPSAATTPATPPLDPRVLQLQVVLDRLGFGPGVIDGRQGQSLKLALSGLQRANALLATGEFDEATKALLAPHASLPGTVEVTLSAADLAGPFVGALPKKEDEQAKLPALGYANPLEMLAERYHTTPETLVALNSPDQKIVVGAKVRVPNVVPASTAYPAQLRPDWKATLAGLSVDSAQPQADHIVVRKADKSLSVYDAQNKLLAQFPVTTGSSHDPLPIGTWKIYGADYNPKFHYNPALFWDAKKGDTKAMLPPGPNGPVGVVWLDLSKEHYGIHGTPEPKNIGRTASHGCVRMTNWDAARLSLMVRPGTPAIFEP